MPSAPSSARWSGRPHQTFPKRTGLASAFWPRCVGPAVHGSSGGAGSEARQHILAKTRDETPDMCRKPAPAWASLFETALLTSGRASGEWLFQLFSYRLRRRLAFSKTGTLRSEPTPCRGPASGRSHQSISTAAPARDGSSAGSLGFRL